MAILKTNKYNINTASVTEDVIPTSNYIYFQHDAYNKSTLAPQFDTFIQHNTTNTTPTGFGVVPQAGYYGGMLQLNGSTATVSCDQSVFNTQNVTTNTIDPTSYSSMSVAYPCKWIYYYTDGTNTSVYQSHIYGQQLTQAQGGGNHTGNTGYNTTRHYFEYKVNPSTDMTKTAPTTVSDTGVNYQSHIPVYVNPVTKNLIAVPVGHSTFYYSPPNATYWYHPGWAYGAKFGTLGSNSAGWTFLSTNQAGYTVQFVGPHADGSAVFLANYLGNDYTQIIWKYQDSDNTQTTLSNPSTAPGAGGSSVGGNRAATFGNYFAKTASCTFTDPNNANTIGWYLPFFDTNGAYVPFYFQWNTATNVITRNTSITVNWGTVSQGVNRTQALVWSVDTLSSTSWVAFPSTTNSLIWGLQRLVHNETFTYSTTRYVMLMQLHGAGGIYDNYPLMRTFVVFSMTANTPTTLVYHSSITIPVTPKNWVWLNIAKTIMGIFTYSYFYMFNFTPALGWTLTGSLPYRFWSVGTDSTGRIWALENSNNAAGIIHLITPSVPVNVVLTPASTTYNYTGTTISSTIGVSTYDQTGTRISTSVKLVIDGGSMTFGGNNLTTTVTTSLSADVTAAISITDGGYSNIIASVVLS